MPGYIDQEDTEAFANSPIEVIRRRVHKLNDMVQGHEGKLGEHGVLISVMTSQVEALRQTTASREQLDNSIRAVTAQLVTFHSENTLKLENFDLKLDNVSERFAPVLKALYWAIALICTGVGIALLELVKK